MLLLISSCSKWQLCHQRIPHKIPFGPLFWCQIIVEGDKMECEVSQKEKAAGRFIWLFACRPVVKIILSMATHVLTLLCFLWFICFSHLLSPNSLCAVNTAKDVGIMFLSFSQEDTAWILILCNVFPLKNQHKYQAMTPPLWWIVHSLKVCPTL